MRRLLASVFALPLLGLGLACSDAPPPEPATSDATNVVARDLADAAEVYDDRLVFPGALIDTSLRQKIAAYAEAAADGDASDVEPVLLVGDREGHAVKGDGTLDEASANPHGFMRRALSLEEDGADVIIHTAPASLEEVFAELDANGSIDIGAEPEGAGPPGKSPQGKQKIDVPTLPLIDLSGVELYRKGNDYVRLSSAYVRLDLALDVGVEVSRLRLQETHVVVEGQVDSELQVEASIFDTPPVFGVPIEKDVLVAKYPLPPLGPVPMTIALRISVGCTVSGGGFQVSGGVGTTVQFSGGVEYTRAGGIVAVGEATHDPYVLDPHGELQASKQVTTRCSVDPRIEVLFYDVAGPVVKAQAYGDFRFVTSPAELSLDVGVNASLGGTLRVFGFKVGDLSAKLFEKNTRLWSAPLE
jgi:hypothetical protein